MRVPTVEESIERAKSEIFRDALDGLFSFAIASFSALHAFVDANEYGGFCEAELHSALRKAYDTEGDGVGFLKYVNSVQGAVDLWLRDGGLALKLWVWLRKGEAHGAR